MSSTRTAILQMPRLNANEDEAKVVALPSGDGTRFEKGDLLFSVETTKAANDVEAPCGGRIVRTHAALEDMVEVGAAICEVEFDDTDALADIDFTWAGDAAHTENHADADTVRVSAKARQVARELGVDIAEIQAHQGKVRVADVQRHAGNAEGASAPAAVVAPQLLAQYADCDAVIFGASGHARAVIDMAQGSGLNLIGAVDDAVAPGTIIAAGVRVLGTGEILETLRGRGLRKAVIGVGGSTSGAARTRIYDKLKALGFEMPSIVARHAHLGVGSTMGAGSYLFPGASVGPMVQIGANCIVNQNVVVAHDSVIEDHVHLAPNAVIAGNCTVKKGATLGMCSTLIYGATVGENCLVHNNVPVTSDLPDGTVLTLRDVMRQLAPKD